MPSQISIRVMPNGAVSVLSGHLRALYMIEMSGGEAVFDTPFGKVVLFQNADGNVCATQDPKYIAMLEAKDATP